MLSIVSNSGPASISMSYIFAWNVEEYISVSKTFQWHVGEGPLFWYRIEWGNPINPDCLPATCTSGISVCSIVPPGCDCTPPPPPACPPGECQVCEQCEVWYVLATSVADLCSRLNKECCNRNMYHKKIFKKIEKYDRPALCCDVAKYIENNIIIEDRYFNVNYFECECISWIDPCDPKWPGGGGRFITPCDSDTPKNPCSPSTVSQFTVFGFTNPSVPTKPGFNMNDIKMMTPQVDEIITKCGILPSNLKLKHNLAKANHLKQFLARNKLKLQEEVDLVYSKSSNSWQNVVHLNGHDEKWTIVFSWLCSDDGDAGNFGWRSDIHISKTINSKKQNARIRAAFTSHGMLDGKNLFGVNFNYNTTTNKVTARQPVIVKNKTMYDEIGMFSGGDWVKDPYLTVNVSVDKKG